MKFIALKLAVMGRDDKIGLEEENKGLQRERMRDVNFEKDNVEYVGQWVISLTNYIYIYI